MSCRGTVGGEFVAETLKATTAYLIDDGESYGQDLIEAARRVMESHGVVVTRESIRRGDVDFSKLAEEIARANPGFVGFGGFNPEAVSALPPVARCRVSRGPSAPAMLQHRC